MNRLIYICHYDGKQCQLATPKLNSEGYLIEPPRVCPELYSDKGWEICRACKRNYSMSGNCYGTLKIVTE